LEGETMTSSVATFAHLASSASRERAGFEATQVIESGGLRIEALVRRRELRSIHVEYKTYQSPWTELQEALSGQVEFVGDELCGLTIDCEGQTSWVVDPSTNTVLRKSAYQLFEPIPGLATLGELSFLDTLTQDFLLRDLGEETSNDRVIRRIGLKPKQTYRSQLLSAVVFPIRKATIDFDTETYFPLSISFVPSSDSSAASILGPNATIRISYKDVRILEASSATHSFSPPADAKLFEEAAITGDELGKQLPFPISTDLLREHGFDPADGMALVSRDAKHDRTYATVQYTSRDASSEEEASSQEEASPRLTLTVGNYVSKTMARRRATFSESGQPASEDSLPVKLLDRKDLWEQRFPGIDTRFAPVEAFFEKDGVFWFLSGTEMNLDSMEALAKDLFASKLETE
jgi:outer membrane lipoprotein-sorting protein